MVILCSASTGAIFSGLITNLVDNKGQFLAIGAVVVFDLVVGVGKALYESDFETKKAFKGVFMLVAFWGLLATVLTIEDGFPVASFLSEAILLPIIIFQLISIVKNLHLVGLISGPLLDRLLINIDKHKEVK